jgi:hypothetical protein
MPTAAVVNDSETRKRLSGPAIRGFIKLAEVWNLKRDEQSDLLGASVSRSTLNNWEAGDLSTLNADQLMRVSFLLGIYEGLQRIWRRAPVEADSWLRRERVDDPFRGKAPLEFMREGGIMALSATRTYVDGLTGGPPSRAQYQQPARGLLADITTRKKKNSRL